MGGSEISSPGPSEEVVPSRIYYSRKDWHYYSRLEHNRRVERRRKAQRALVPVNELVPAALLAMLRRRDGE
jgi:hypothetical protein